MSLLNMKVNMEKNLRLKLKKFFKRIKTKSYLLKRTKSIFIPKLKTAHAHFE